MSGWADLYVVLRSVSQIPYPNPYGPPFLTGAVRPVQEVMDV